VNKPARDLSIHQKEAPRRNVEADIDAKLVKRCKNGDEAAFAELVERYQRKVYSIALGMVKNQEDAMDIAQDAFVKVHRYLGNFQGTSSFYTWLYRIVFNLSIDHVRKEGKRSNTEFDEKVGYRDATDDSSDFMANRSDLNPAKVIGRKELADRIQEAISELPPYHQAVIILREVEGLSYTEMAKIMKVSKGTIMSRLHHARQKLRRTLGPYIDGELILRD
jgi:RNA polymerase sigma-70 factor, ECF subfamily